MSKLLSPNENHLEAIRETLWLKEKEWKSFGDNNPSSSCYTGEKKTLCKWTFTWPRLLASRVQPSGIWDPSCNDDLWWCTGWFFIVCLNLKCGSLLTDYIICYKTSRKKYENYSFLGLQIFLTLKKIPI